MGSSADRHQRLRAVFDEALTLDPSARETFLNDACDGDAELRADVARLLAVHLEARSFLEHPLDLLTATRGEVSFAGTDRFRVRRRLGAGGMGVVYEVQDQLRGETVALKTLLRTGAADLYRLKREFRSLADVTHPNLVCLYELFVENDHCFFTMELVAGTSFIDYARGIDHSQLVVERLVPALQQLIDGVAALHRRGKLHRDIKPSNVMVTPEGRVVILDFGLIAEVRPASLGDVRTVSGGTPAYLSPEEAAGATPSEASDWYSVGVTLYEALTGRVPFDGSVADVLRRKQAVDPPTPRHLAGGDAPDDLSAICMALLSRHPDRRQKGIDAFQALLRKTMPSTLPIDTTTIADAPFVGRQPQLQLLHEASDALRTGQPRVVTLYGPSGIGKSALVRRFLSLVRERDSGVVLAGRCYDNESVPYKALDGVVDDLSDYLGSLPANEIEALLPHDVAALTRVFPVLLQVRAVAKNARGQDTESLDPLRVRRQAFDALRALLARLATRQPLIVWIDDLQWADADSTVLLEEILSPPNPPSMLTVLSFRSEEIAAKPFLQALRDRAGQHGWTTLSLQKMTDEEAHALIGGLLTGPSALTDLETRRLTRDADGSPFVLEQLALYAGTSPGAPTQSSSLAGMFETRLDALTRDARGFLETLAICGRPMAPEIVFDACDIARDRQSLIVMLRAAHFIRSSGSSARVESYHDRIREALTERIDPDAVRDIHGRLVASLVARKSDDYEVLFEHYRGAGDAENASVQAGLAAQRASDALAFDRAASFYAAALDLAPSAPDAGDRRIGLANALANAGRPAEAAEAYLRAAESAGHAQRVELQRRAAEQFLTGGHIDRGLELIRRGLEGVGLRYPRSPRSALVSVVWRRLRLRARGLQFTTRTSGDIDSDTLLRLDTCWAAATGLALVDLVTASDFAAQHLHLALDAGEPARIVRGMALESAARSTDWTFRKSRRPLAERSSALAKSLGTPQATAMTLLADSLTATSVGEWRRALGSSEQALAILRDQCVGVTWELNMAQNILIWALMYLGEYGEVSRRVPAVLADARRRGNLYLATELCTRSQIVWLIADQPDEGERETIEEMSRWSHKGFHRQHYSARLARVQTALYRGDAATAWQLLLAEEAGLRRSMLLQVQAVRVEALYLHGRCAIALALEDPSRRHLLAVARRCARRIARQEMPWSNPIGLLLQAGIASVEGKPTLARSHLEHAAEQFDRAEMRLYAAVSRRRLGALRDDETGRALQQQAEAWMASQTIKNPTRMTRMLVPGFSEP